MVLCCQMNISSEKPVGTKLLLFRFITRKYIFLKKMFLVEVTLEHMSKCHSSRAWRAAHDFPAKTAAKTTQIFRIPKVNCFVYSDYSVIEKE